MRKIDAFLLLSLLFFLPAFVPAVEKLRLGDIPDETDKQAEQKVQQLEQSQELTPEERKRVTEQLADDAYIDGMKAERAGNYFDAKRYFETAVSLAPNHGQAKQGVLRINRLLRPVTPPASATKAPSPEPVVSKKSNANRPVAKPALSSQEAKEKSNALYLKALSASQNGNFEEAYKFCRESLKLDPDNLQARRMVERLEIRMKKT